VFTFGTDWFFDLKNIEIAQRIRAPDTFYELAGAAWDRLRHVFLAKWVPTKDRAMSGRTTNLGIQNERLVIKIIFYEQDRGRDRPRH
jgi:hypothetical protein